MNDVINRVRGLHQQLLEDPEYEQYVTAQTEAEAVEGSLYCDTDMAAMMIRQVAVATWNGPVVRLRLFDLGVILEQITGRLGGRPPLQRPTAQSVGWDTPENT
jgi:hypothetical protein